MIKCKNGEVKIKVEDVPSAMSDLAKIVRALTKMPDVTRADIEFAVGLGFKTEEEIQEELGKKLEELMDKFNSFFAEVFERGEDE